MPSNLPVPLTQNLTPKQIAFAEAYVLKLGGRNASGAAALAGYSTAGNGHQAVASRLLRDPRVLALIRHLVLTDVQASAVCSMAVLQELQDDIGVPPDTRRKAALNLLEQAGYLVEKFATVRHVVENGVASKFKGRRVEQLEELRRYAEAAGMTVTNQQAWDEAMRVHGIMDEQDAAQPDAIDTDYEVIQGDDGRSGLGDLI
jgi:phage terminase small subunit